MRAKLGNLQLFNSTKLIIGMLILVFAFLQYELWLSDGGVRSLMGLNQQIDHQTQIVQHISKTNSVLEADIADLRHGAQATEERAREHLGMVEKGETYYQFIK